MQTHTDNIEKEINEKIDNLISVLNERRERLLSILRIKRVELKAVQAVDEQVEQQLVEARAALISQKMHNKLQSMHRRMLNEVDTKIHDYIRPSKELRFEMNTRDLETEIASLGEITLHELPILVPKCGINDTLIITPPATYISEKEPPRIPLRSKSHSSTATPTRDAIRSLPREETKQCLWGRMSREDCETLLLQRAKQGEFIFRESPNREGELVLSMRYRNTVYHFNILKKDDWLCLGDKYRMRSIDEIVSFFQKTRIATYKEVGDKLIDVFLSQPLNMNEVEIKV